MKKVVFALVLAATALTAAPYMYSQAAAGSQSITIKDPAEYNEYTNAIGQAQPAAKAAAIETFLTHYPQSVVYNDMLEQLVVAYSAVPDAAKAIDSANRLLKIDPNNARAIFTVAYFKSQQAGAATDPTAQQALLDDSATYAKRGLAMTKPAGVSDADWTKTTSVMTPLFHSYIGAAAYHKGDYPTAITEYTAELKSMPVAQTAVPSQALQDTFFLGVSYFKNTPPDYINCVWYADRAAHFAPPQYQAQFLPTAKYCYNKYHGKMDGFDAIEAMQAPTQLMPPATYTIAPAPKPADIAHQVVTSTPDLATGLALADKEFVLTNGTQTAATQPTPAPATPATDADMVWATLKGQTTKLTDMTVVSATADVVTLSVSDDAIANGTADFSIAMKTPLKTVPVKGDKLTVIGTFDSYDKSPFLIHMIDGEVPAKAPAHRPSAAHRAR
jgi:tetratricopeptide (TPR) repeat protein